MTCRHQQTEKVAEKNM